MVEFERSFGVRLPDDYKKFLGTLIGVVVLSVKAHCPVLWTTMAGGLRR